jgi:ribonuclease PH
MRSDERQHDEVRPLVFDVGVQKHPAGSVLVSLGETKVLCAVSVEDKVPPHRQGSGGGWLTAEYAMLPGSTSDRKKRDGAKPDGRSVEIQRLIGRSLRAVVDLERLGPRTLWVDCDVLQADGSTRCASICGAAVAVSAALRKLGSMGALPRSPSPLREMVAAVSVGIVDGEVIVDLCQHEDNRAQVDMNVVATASGRIVEVQGTAEGAPFHRGHADEMLDRALQAIVGICRRQQRVLEVSL